jgi:hypothetical protein
MIAASKGRVDVMKLLLAADPPVKLNQQQTDEGHTALFIAVMHNHVTTMQLLLEAGASPRIADTNGVLPLNVCKSPEAVKMLVDAAPELVNHTCSKGGRALAYLTNRDLLEELFASCARHNIQIDVNHADVDGDTALHMAMMERTGSSGVQLLLEKGAGVFGVGYRGTTVLMKPFLSVDQDVVAGEDGRAAEAEEERGGEADRPAFEAGDEDLAFDDDIAIGADEDDITFEAEEKNRADSEISESMKSIMDHVLALNVAETVEKKGGVDDTEDVGEEPAAKRQRR